MSASRMSSNPTTATRSCRPRLRRARSVPIVIGFWVGNSAVGPDPPSAIGPQTRRPRARARSRARAARRGGVRRRGAQWRKRCNVRRRSGSTSGGRDPIRVWPAASRCRAAARAPPALSDVTTSPRAARVAYRRYRLQPGSQSLERCSDRLTAGTMIRPSTRRATIASASSRSRCGSSSTLPANTATPRVRARSSTARCSADEKRIGYVLEHQPDRAGAAVARAQAPRGQVRLVVEFRCRPLTRAASSGSTVVSPLITLETVFRLTRARAATWRIVGRGGVWPRRPPARADSGLSIPTDSATTFPPSGEVEHVHRKGRISGP